MTNNPSADTPDGDLCTLTILVWYLIIGTSDCRLETPVKTIELNFRCPSKNIN